MTNFIEGKVLNEKLIKIDDKQIDFIGHGFATGTKVLIAARPECIQLSEKKNKNTFEGKVVDIEFLGSFIRIYLETSITPNQVLIVDKPMVGGFDKSISIGDVVGFMMVLNHLNIYECDK
jgi:ABC-type Fe3+/spermidine/putrescine transport system ATPase subunit